MNVLLPDSELLRLPSGQRRKENDSIGADSTGTAPASPRVAVGSAWFETTPALQALVTEFARRHGYDANAPHGRLYLKRGEETLLLLESGGPNLLVVSDSRRFEGLGQVVFFLAEGQWIPIISEPFSDGYIGVWHHVLAYPVEGNASLLMCAPAEQRALARICEDWARELAESGDLQAGPNALAPIVEDALPNLALNDTCQTLP